MNDKSVSGLADDGDQKPLMVDFDTTGMGSPEEVVAAMRRDSERFEASIALLPGWLTWQRLVNDPGFGLVTTAGLCLCVEAINGVWQDATGGIWLNVTFMKNEPPGVLSHGLRLVTAMTDHARGTVNTANVVAIVEFFDHP